jgi:hypothetical protein
MNTHLRMTVSEIADDLERIQIELLRLQREVEAIDGNADTSSATDEGSQSSNNAER